MSDCINSYFMYNSEIKDTHYFSEELIKNGKAIYEVVRVIKGVPIFLNRHLKRMENSARILNKELWMNEREIKKSLAKLLQKNNVKEGNIKFIFFFSNDSDEGNLFLAYLVKHYYPTTKEYECGVNTILYHGERKNPNAKVINHDFRKIVDEKIKEANAFEAILVDKEGNITEGSKSNIFMIKDGAVITSPIHQVLPGITREVIIELCKEKDILVKEEKINYNQLNHIDALFISGTSPKVLPINKVNDIIFESSRNSVVLSIMSDYNKSIEEYIDSNTYRI